MTLIINTLIKQEVDSAAAITAADSQEQTRSSQTSSSSGNLYNRPAIQAPPPTVSSPPSPSVQRARRLEEFMTGTVALTVLELGYSTDMIEQLVTRRLEMIGKKTGTRKLYF